MGFPSDPWIDLRTPPHKSRKSSDLPYGFRIFEWILPEKIYITITIYPLVI